jgi:hypothetical protein
MLLCVTWCFSALVALFFAIRRRTPSHEEITKFNRVEFTKRLNVKIIICRTHINLMM